MAHYSSQEVIELLGAEGEAHLAANGLAPLTESEDGVVYDAPYINQLVAKIRAMALDAPPAYDPHFAHLHYLGRLYQPYTGQRDPQPERQAIAAQLQQLVAQGVVVKVAYVRSKLTKPVPLHTINPWTVKGTFIVVKIGGVRYLTTTYADRVIWALNECKTMTEMALSLGVGREAFYSAVRRQDLPTFIGPDGLKRINPAKIPSTAGRTHTGLTSEQLARRLSVKPSMVQKAVSKGVVRASPVELGNPERIIPENEVTYWEDRFTVLRPGFEWLQAQLGSELPPVLDIKEAAEILQVPERTMHRWSANGSLPHYLRSFGKNPRHRLVASYIRGLAAFAGPGPVQYEQVRAYAAACANAGRIL